MSKFIEEQEEAEWRPDIKYEGRIRIDWSQRTRDDEGAHQTNKDKSALINIFNKIEVELGSEINNEPEINSKETIIDSLAYYIPYHWNYKRWGIYFRIYKMLDDFKLFIMRPEVAIKTAYDIRITSCLWRFYCSTVYLHELSHHAIEDTIALKEEETGKSLYATPNQYKRTERSHEEGFCEYNAFSGIAKPGFLPVPPSRIRLKASSMWRMFHIPFYGNRCKVIDKNSFLSVLYNHLGRATFVPYIPKIDAYMINRCGVFWRSIWDLHQKIGSTCLVNGTEVYSRLYLSPW